MSSNETLLEARNISKVFPNGGAGLHVLENINLSVADQEFLCIVGPSGCGKTTLLRILGGLLEPSQGEICFEGERLSHPRRRIGFVFQNANLMPWRTVKKNISLPLELQGQTSQEIVEPSKQLIELVDLAGFDEMYPSDLSGGMAQRVAIARALVHKPDILLLDEPFGSLDALTREQMGEELLRIWSSHPVTIIMVTHSISEAVFLADRVIVLSERPASIVSNRTVDIPRPRTLEVTYSDQFGVLATSIRADLARTGKPPH
jgi:NitT/TauT family transport system ATP-binding protein